VLRPEELESCESLVLRHLRDLRIAQSHAVDEEVNEIRGKCLYRGLRASPVWQDPVSDTAPELLLGDLELVSQDVSPKAGPVGRTVRRM
jgi:hypothetical protein